MSRNADLVECDGGDFEPTMVQYIHATIVIHDGRGGTVRFDKSEVNDLVKNLSGLLASDAPPIRTVDLTAKTGV
jgi:hypothetical protein